MKIGLSSAAFYGRLETEDAAAHLRDFPISFGEVFLQTFSEYKLAFGETVRDYIGGLPCLSIHCKGSQFEGDLFSACNRQREDAFKLFTGALGAAQALGAKYYVFHGPRSSVSPLQIPHIDEVLPKLNQACQLYGVTLLWENVSWCPLHKPQDAAALRKAFKDTAFVLDLKQAYRSRQDPFAFLSVMGDKLMHLHALDWHEDGTLCLPGEGIFDFPRLSAHLKDMGYGGGILLEPYAPQAMDEAALTRSLRYLLDVFNG